MKHEIFANEDDAGPDVVSLTIVRKLRGGRTHTYPDLIPVEACPDTAALFELVGGGSYDVQGKGPTGKIVGRRQIEFEGAPKPFDPDADPDPGEDEPLPPPPPPTAADPSQALMLMMFQMMQEERRAAREMQAQQTQVLVAALNGNNRGGGDSQPLAEAIKALGAIKAQPPPPPPAAAAGELAAFMRGVKFAQSTGEDGGEDDGLSLQGLINMGVEAFMRSSANREPPKQQRAESMPNFTMPPGFVRSRPEPQTHIDQPDHVPSGGARHHQNPGDPPAVDSEAT